MQANAQLSFLNCYICFQAPKKPKMCPACSKVACEKCLRSWVEQRRPQCPHCRKVMPLSSFAQCQRIISEAKQLVKALDKGEKAKEKCPEHQIEMTYYCQVCEIAICSDCGMFSQKHKGHKITHLKKIYQVYKNKILNQLTHYDQKIESYRQNGHQIKVQMQKLVMEIGQRKNFIEQYFVAIIQRLEQQFKQKQDKISGKYDANSKQIQFLESFRENIYREFQSASQKQLINKCDELIGYIQSVFDKGPEFQHQEYNFDTIHEIVPKYNEFEYILKNYDDLGEAIVYSDPYDNNSIQWRLKIYPKGNGQAKQNYLSVFLEMSKGNVNGNKYEYKIQLVNKKSPKDSVTREYSSNFDIGQCWGYNQFIPIEQLREEFLTAEGHLIFKISVRNPSYRSLVRDQNQYIRILQQKLKNMNKNQGPSQPQMNNIPSSPQKSAKSNNKIQLNQKNLNINNKVYELAEQSRSNRQRMKKFLMDYSQDKQQIMKQLQREHEELRKYDESQHDKSQDEQDDQIPAMLKLYSNRQKVNKNNINDFKNISSMKNIKKCEQKKVEDNGQQNLQFDLQLELELEHYNLEKELLKKQKERNDQKQKQKLWYQQKLLKQKKASALKKEQQEKKQSNNKQYGSLSMFNPRLMSDSQEDFEPSNSSLSASINLSNSSYYNKKRSESKELDK